METPLNLPLDRPLFQHIPWGSGLKNRNLFLVRGDYTKSRPRIKQVWHDKIPSWQLALWKGMWDLSLMSDIFSYGTQSIKQIINDQSINQSMISLSNWLRIHLIKTWTYSNEKKWKKVLQSFITYHLSVAIFYQNLR